MQVLFISSVSIITREPSQSRKLFVDAIGLPLESPPGDDYAFTEKIGGARHFGVWPLAQAAQACFGTADWPTDRPVPQVSIEFDVASPDAVREAASELESRGYSLLHGPKTEPWGQTLARIQSTDGAIIGVSYTPPMHEQAK